MQISCHGQHFSPTTVGPFVVVPHDLLPGRIEITYALPQRKMLETVDGEDYTLTWRGDEIIGIEPNMDFLLFYPTPSQPHGVPVNNR